MTSIEFQNALKIVRNTIKNDKELYYSYQSNIAVPFMDSCYRNGIKSSKLHKAANEAAKSFLDLWLKE